MALLLTLSNSNVALWLSLLHNFIQLSLNSGSAQVQILLARRVGDSGWRGSVAMILAGDKAKRLLATGLETRTT